MEKVNQIALKEWAVATEALGTGEQILMMRKGGIHEETKDFQIEDSSFYFFPTYLHQKKELIKPQFHPMFDHSIKEYNDKEITIKYYAEVVEDIEIYDYEQLKKLETFHIWTEDLAESRLNWKKDKPLHLLLLRVYQLRDLFKIEMKDEFNGCKSWLSIDAPLLKTLNKEPVLKNEEFYSKLNEIKKSLSSVLT